VKSQGQDLDSGNGNAADDSNVDDTLEEDDFKTDYADDEDSPSQNTINDDKKDNDAMLNKTDDDDDYPGGRDNAATPDTRSAAGEDKDTSFDIVEDDDTDGDDEDDDDDDDGINIDPGFLKDAAGKEVNMPNTATTTTSTVAPPSSPKATSKGNATNNGGPTIVFYFCLMGGTNAEGPVGLIDMLHIGLGQQQQQMPMAAIAALPSALTGESSAAYTDAGITACGTGITLLTPYGYSYLPGSCYGYSFAQARWNDTGSRLASYRKGASITRVGKYLVAAGGSRGRRSLRSIEVKENVTHR
jgi:hypothetical protein